MRPLRNALSTWLPMLLVIACGRAPGPSSPATSDAAAVRDDEGLALAGDPYLLANSMHVAEGTGAGYSHLAFTLHLSQATTKPVSVHYATQDRTAKAGLDYVAAAGTAHIAPGALTTTVTVDVIEDRVAELTESLAVILSQPVNAQLLTPTLIGTILDDDTAIAPRLTIPDVVTPRGLSGTRTMRFAVTLNTSVDHAVSVTATTGDLTAKAGVDYVAKMQTLTFAPGETVHFFDVTIYGAATPTGDKILLVQLSNAGVPLARSTGAGILRYGP